MAGGGILELCNSSVFSCASQCEALHIFLRCEKEGLVH